MAQSDNTLGAPTEGLGQTVTFAAGGQSGVPQTTAGPRGTLRGQQQAQGAQTSTRAQIDTRQRSDGTAQLLYKMGSEFLRPHVEAAQQEQYFKGMQEASAGNAITDIVADQPWYSKVFGSTSLVDGARAYSANAVAQNFSVMAETEMPKLRTMSPAEIQKWSVDKMAAGKTGDPGTDALAMQAMSKVLPRIYERQAKENLLWHTENLTKSFLASGAAGASALTATLSRSTEQSPFGSLDAPRGDSTTEVDKLAAGVDYVTSLVRPASMPEATHNKLLLQVAKGMMDSKQLGAFNVLKKSGLVGALPIEYKDYLDKYEQRTELDIRASPSPEFQTELASLRVLANKPNASAADLAHYRAYSADLNSRFRTSTGISGDLVSSHDNITSQTHLMASIEHADEQQRKQYTKALDLAQTEQEKKLAADAVAKADMGHLANGGNPKMLPAKEKAAAYMGLWGVGDSSLPHDQWVGAVAKAWNYEDIDSAAQGRITSDMQQVASNPLTFAKVYDSTYLPLVKAGGEKLAATYFGNRPEHAAMMATYHAAITGKELTPDNIGVAHARATAPISSELKPNSKGDLSAEDSAILKATQAAVTGFSESSGAIPWYSKTGVVKDPVIAEFAGRVAYLAKKLPDSVPADQRAEYGIKMLRAQGTNFVGGYMVTASGGAPDFVDSLRSYKAPANSKGQALRLIPPGQEHEAVVSAVDYFAKASGIEDAQVLQATGAREDGDASLIIMGNVTVRGVTSIGYRQVPAKLIAEHWSKKEEFAKDHPFYRGGGAPYTPGITDANLKAAYKKYQDQQPK